MDDPTSAAQQHLDWSGKQMRILTGGDRADELYVAERGYPFQPEELPHYHLQRHETHSTFAHWKGQSVAVLPAGTKRKAPPQDGDQKVPPLVGAWARTLFYGGWEHTSSHDERTYNLQTPHLFIDLRIPKTRERVLFSENNKATSLQDLTKEQLRYYARQHVFAGYTQMMECQNNNDSNSNNQEYLCTRHHCIDWNYVGVPRSRPNKWYAEFPSSSPQDKWKEWAFAKDERGQHYYCEHWERLPDTFDGNNDDDKTAPTMVALRRQMPRDGMLLVIGDHFNYILDRDISKVPNEDYNDANSLVGLVDAALDQDDLSSARAYLSLQGGHGRVSHGWKIDCAIEPWNEGTPLWTNRNVSFQNNKTGRDENDMQQFQLTWNGDVWQVFDSSFSSVEELKKFFLGHMPE